MLPDEILIIIFAKLSPKDLLNITETCIHFNELISQTQILTKKLSLKIDFRTIFWNCSGEVNTSQSIGALWRTERKYESLVVVNLVDHSVVTKLFDFAEEIFDRFSKELKSVKFVRCEFNSCDLIECLGFIKHLENLCFKEVEIIVVPVSSKCFKLRFLKDLKFIRCRNMFFECFVHSEQLERLTVIDFGDIAGQIDEVALHRTYNPVDGFLSQQRNLKHLVIQDSKGSEDYFKTNKDAFKFQLSSFEWEGVSLKNLMNFLGGQVSLQKIKLHKLENHEEVAEYQDNKDDYNEVLRFILCLEDLEELSIHLWNDKDIYSLFRYSCASLTSLEIKLSISCQLSDETEFNINFPNLKILTVDGADGIAPKIIQALSSLKKLNVLNIHADSGSILRDLNVKTLSHLKVYLKDFSIEDWQEFTNNHPQLEILQLEASKIDNPTIELIVSNLKELKHLSITSFCFNLTEINELTLRLILENCNNLKRLELELPSSCKNLRTETVVLLNKLRIDCKFSYYNQISLRQLRINQK